MFSLLFSALCRFCAILQTKIDAVFIKSEGGGAGQLVVSHLHFMHILIAHRLKICEAKQEKLEQ